MIMTSMETLTAEGAQIAIEAAEQAARNLGIRLSTSVVDASSQLLAFRRMDGASLIGISMSRRKAETAAMLGAPTKAFQDMVNGGATMLVGAPELCPVQGAVPIIVDGVVIGAIGCSGASGEEDETAAQAGADAVSAASA